MGVVGIAISLGVSYYASALLSFWSVRSERRFAPDEPGSGEAHPGPTPSAVLSSLCLLAIPFVAEQVLFNGGKLLVQMFVVGMGAEQVSANAIANSLISIGEIIPQAMCVGLVPLVGQVIGARDIDGARRVTTSFLWLSTIISVACCGAMLLIYPWLLDIYNTPAAVRGDVYFVFLISSAARLLGFWSLSFLLPSTLRAGGDAVFTTVTATVTMALRMLCIWVVAVKFEQGVVGVWSVMASEWVVRSVVFSLRYRNDRWIHRLQGAESENS